MIDKQQILDDHLFNADFANLTNNQLRQLFTIQEVISLRENNEIQ